MEASAFAKRLAANEQPVRDRALKKLRKYIASRTAKAGFSREELMKLWKGLHYCFWMQDKPLLQEELSAKLCGLLKVFPDGDSALAFASAFFTTQANEWGRLDQWRMDKYMMLIRDFLHATFEVLKKHQWQGALVAAMSTLVEEVMDAKKEHYPDGLRLHLADIYLVELEKVGAEELDGNTIDILLKPFVNYITYSKRDTIVERIIKSIFVTIRQTARTENKKDKKAPTLKYNYSSIQQTLFAAGRKKDVRPKARRRIYKLVKGFSGVGVKITEKDENENSLKKRKHPAAAEEEEPKKKQKKVNNSTHSTQLETPSDHKDRPKTPQDQEKKIEKKKVTPGSTPKHVEFDLERNSSRGLQEFVMSAASDASPYLPSRSPSHGILKDSPRDGSASTTRLPSAGSGQWAIVDTPTGATSHKTDKLFKKGGISSPEPHSTSSGKKKSPRGEQSSRFVSKKKGRMMKKPRRR